MEVFFCFTQSVRSPKQAAIRWPWPPDGCLLALHHLTSRELVTVCAWLAVKHPTHLSLALDVLTS